jgi:hypothetical protein
VPLRLPGVTARVIAGDSHGVAQKAHAEPLYLDLHLAQGAKFEHALPAGHNAFVYVYRGRAGDRLRHRAQERPTRSRPRPIAKSRPVRDEQAGRDLPGRGGLPRRQVRRAPGPLSESVPK